MGYLRLALRQLIKNPAFSAVAIITLALGIGANTAIFSIVNAVLLRPLPYPDADRIMVLNESSGPKQDFSVALPDYFDWRNDNTVFEHLAATHKESRNLSGIPGREPERVSCASVTRNFFNIIGLPPEIGRTFSEDEDKVGAPPVVVISDRLWQRAFNRDPGVIGRSINLHDQSFTVIGVMPLQLTSPQDSDAWVSIMRRSNNPAWMDRSHHPMIFVWGKLKAGVTVDQARTETAKFTRSSRRCLRISSANTEPISDCSSAQSDWCCSSPARTSPICLPREEPRGRGSSPFTPQLALPACKLFANFCSRVF